MPHGRKTKLGTGGLGPDAIALDALLQGSRSRAYGIEYMTQAGQRRASIALTPEQRELVDAALRARSQK